MKGVGLGVVKAASLRPAPFLFALKLGLYKFGGQSPSSRTFIFLGEEQFHVCGQVRTLNLANGTSGFLSREIPPISVYR